MDFETGLDSDFVNELTNGKLMSFDNNTPTFKLKNKTKELPDVIGTSLSHFFINDKVKAILKKEITEQEINFLPVKLDIHTFWLVNIVGLLDCFDYKNSEYTTFKNGLPRKIFDIKFIENNIPEIAIFRIKESPIKLFITEKLKNILEEAGVTGVKYSDNMDLTMGI
ncbi:imm11 family protein [Dokdonia pacifica]|nr:DUF1629 domain-containing protein [Dokdonia pacifica]